MLLSSYMLLHFTGASKYKCHVSASKVEDLRVYFPGNTLTKMGMKR